VKRDDCVVAVHRPAEEHAHFERVERLRHRVELGLEILRRRFAGVLNNQLLERLQVGDLLIEILQRIELGPNRIGLADDFLRGLRLVPEPVCGHFGL